MLISLTVGFVDAHKKSRAEEGSPASRTGCDNLASLGGGDLYTGPQPVCFFINLYVPLTLKVLKNYITFRDFASFFFVSFAIVQNMPLTKKKTAPNR